jgi:protein AroM
VLTFVTIGQSPRSDVIPELIDIIGKSFEYKEIGLLDFPENLQSLKLLNIESGEEFLVSRLRDGEEVKMPREWVVQKLNEIVPEIEEFKVLLCTENFDLPNLILPVKILESFVSILKPKKLGVVVPAKGQIDMVKNKWERLVEDLKITYFSPYSTESGDLSVLNDRELIVLDCIGYGKKDENYLRSYTGGIVVSARRLLANFLRNNIL